MTDIDVTAIDGRYPAIVIDIDACARGSLSPAGVTESEGSLNPPTPYVRAGHGDDTRASRLQAKSRRCYHKHWSGYIIYGLAVAGSAGPLRLPCSKVH